jgi:hypothetical protein
MKTEQALGEEAHWRAASTRWGGGVSLETPHNDVHVACGFPMTSVTFAAFHPVFFLHHCNIDRLYEGYLRAQVLALPVYSTPALTPPSYCTPALTPNGSM